MNDVVEEMDRQHQKWGQQDHPSADPTLVERSNGCTPQRMCNEYGLPSEEVAKSACQRAAQQGTLTWPDILVEEMSEAVSAAADGTEGKLRDELVQVAAVAMTWIECIDRKAQ